MKKKLFVVLSLMLLLVPVFGMAKEKKYESTNLKETFKIEEIEIQNEKYKETDKQVTIYLFRGDGCGYCHSFLEFLNDISEEYGKYFKLEAYEIWANSDNNELWKKVSNFFGEEAGGVPYIVIGDEVFRGYNEQYNDAMIKKIKEEYKSKDKYDVLEEIKIAEEKAEQEAKREKVMPIVWDGIFTLISTLSIMAFISYKDKKNIKKKK